MNTKLSLLVERLSELPKSVQAEAARSLIDLEKRHSLPIALNQATSDFVQEGIDAFERGDYFAHASVMERACKQIMG